MPSQRRDHRDAPHLQPGQHLSPLGDQRNHAGGQRIQQDRISLELVLFEVLIRYPTRAKDEPSRQPAARTNLTGKIHGIHERQA